MKTHVPRRIAPRLFSGEKRLNWGGRLPPEVKEGIRRIARKENKSVSFVLEEVVIDYFALDRPQYVTQNLPAATTEAPRKSSSLAARVREETADAHRRAIAKKRAS